MSIFKLIPNKEDFDRQDTGLYVYERNYSHEYRTSLKVDDTVFFLNSQNEIKSSKITEVLGKFHSFGMGYALILKLENNKIIDSFYCFSCPEDICARLIERIAEEERKSNQEPITEIVFPIIKKINPQLISEQILSAEEIMTVAKEILLNQPMIDKNSDLFIK